MQIRSQCGLRWAWVFAILWNLVLELASGGRATVSAMLRDRREAEWLAGAIRCSLSR